MCYTECALRTSMHSSLSLPLSLSLSFSFSLSSGLTHQLELVASLEGLLDARVCPQRFQRLHVPVEVLGRELVGPVVVGHCVAIRLVVCVLQRDLQPPPGLHQDLGAFQDVVEDDTAKIEPVVVRVLLSVNDTHLLDERALARLACAQEKDLDLLAEVLLLLRQLPVYHPAPAQRLFLFLGEPTRQSHLLGRLGRLLVYEVSGRRLGSPEHHLDRHTHCALANCACARNKVLNLDHF